MTATRCRPGWHRVSVSQRGGHIMREVIVSKNTGASAIFSGTTWFVFWLFTIGFVDLSFWQGVFAIIFWPYYLGVALA